MGFFWLRLGRPVLLISDFCARREDFFPRWDSQVERSVGVLACIRRGVSPDGGVRDQIPILQLNPRNPRRARRPPVAGVTPTLRLWVRAKPALSEPHTIYD